MSSPRRLRRAARQPALPVPASCRSENRILATLSMNPASSSILIAATLNKGKLQEIQSCLASLGYRVAGLESLDCVEPSREDGNTFEANARQKAIHYSRVSGHLTLADDSGLEVDALGGEPGVRSARFVSKDASDEQRYREVLARMEPVPEGRRSARFICCLALARHGQVLQVFKGRVEGQIARHPRGESGFGYDPIFLLPALGKTMAELSAEEKNLWSHRGEALRKLAAYLGWRRRQWPETRSGKGS